MKHMAILLTYIITDKIKYQFEMNKSKHCIIIVANNYYLNKKR